MDKDGRPTWEEGGGSIQHDWYQNDSTAADYIKNRPGGYTETTPGYEITWDGAVGDNVVVDAGEKQLVKVSDRVFTVEELIGSTMIFGDTSLIVSNDAIMSQNGIITNEGFLVCSTPTTAETAIVPALMLTITWDGTTNGKTKFTTSKNENFYKMSSLKIPIGAFVGTYKRSDSTAKELSTSRISQDCYRYGNDIVVVLKPGTYVDNIMLGEFTASEPGVYFQARPYATSYTLTINYEADPYYNALLMMSSDGTKKFKITIDDTGVLKATEVTI